jgi:hypothetical protein
LISSAGVRTPNRVKYSENEQIQLALHYSSAMKKEKKVIYVFFYMIINLVLYTSSISSKKLCFISSPCSSLFLLSVLTHIVLIILTKGILFFSLFLFVSLSLSLYPAQLAYVDRRCADSYFPKHAHTHL